MRYSKIEVGYDRMSLRLKIELANTHPHVAIELTLNQSGMDVVDDIVGCALSIENVRKAPCGDNSCNNPHVRQRLQLRFHSPGHLVARVQEAT